MDRVVGSAGFLLLAMCVLPLVPSVAEAEAPSVAGRSQLTQPAADTVFANAGEIYLGGNHLKRPYVLTYYKGLLVVNGLQLPRAEEPVIVVNDTIRAQYELLAHVDSLAYRKLSFGWSESQIVELMRTEYASSPLVKGVEATRPGVWIEFANGMRFLRMLPLEVPRPLPDPRAIQGHDIADLKQTLDMGATVIIVGHAERVIIPKNVPWQLSESALGQFRNPVPLVRVP